MADYERRFQQLQGSDFENEIAKIMTRYGNEGRLESMAPQGLEGRKQVRFNENYEGEQMQQQVEN